MLFWNGETLIWVFCVLSIKYKYSKQGFLQSFVLEFMTIIIENELNVCGNDHSLVM